MVAAVQVFVLNEPVYSEVVSRTFCGVNTWKAVSNTVRASGFSCFDKTKWWWGIVCDLHMEQNGNLTVSLWHRNSFTVLIIQILIVYHWNSSKFQVILWQIHSPVSRGTSWDAALICFRAPGRERESASKLFSHVTSSHRESTEFSWAEHHAEEPGVAFKVVTR